MSTEREIGNRMADLLLRAADVSTNGQFKDKADEVLKEWKLVTASTKVKYDSLKECLNEMLFASDNEEDELDMYNLDAKPWPNAKTEEGDDAGPLDMENYEIMELTDTRFRMVCGGDWQVPMELVMELVDGVLTIVSAAPVEQYKEGMDEEEFKKILLEQ